MVELRGELSKNWRRAQLDLERSLGMRQRGSRWRRIRPVLPFVGLLSLGTLVWSFSSRMGLTPDAANGAHRALRGGAGNEAPGPHMLDKHRTEVSLRGLRKQGSIKMGHLDFLAEAEGVHDVEAALDRLNNRFEAMPVHEQPLEVLKWAYKTLPEGKWAQVTSFGPSGLVILDLAARSDPPVLPHMPVITIDTLHLFPETYELIQRIKNFYKTRQIKSYHHKHAASLEEFDRKYGDKLFKGDPTLYDYVTKIEPMKRALNELHAVAWITGRRKSQGGERVFLKLFEIDPADGRLKLNPVVNWGREEIWKYIKDNGVPYNKLHDSGYTSIGDTHSTVKVMADEEGERTGRFRGENRSECGMHHSNTNQKSDDLNKRAERIRAGYAWEQGAKIRAENLGILQVTEETFEAVVGNAKTNLLLEIYAPWCSHCQHFEPKFNALTEQIRGQKTKYKGADSLQVLRMDGFENKLPSKWSGRLPFDSFPTLYLITRSGAPGAASLRATKYKGQSHEPDDVLQWIDVGLRNSRAKDLELAAFMN